jgi:hypothetical protein
MDQPNLFIGVEIAAAGALTKRFLATAPSRRAPIVPQLFCGTSEGVNPLSH